MQCSKCSYEVVSIFKFCPECGTMLQTKTQSSKKVISIRYLSVIADYEVLTNTKLSEEQKLQFIEYAQVGQLSVNTSERRVAAAKQVLVPNSDGTFKLDVPKWVKAMYEIEDPRANLTERVWTTPGGVKYHRSRDCEGLVAGQSFASWKGKETYKLEFVTLKDAAWISGKSPCEVCKPEKWINT